MDDLEKRVVDALKSLAGDTGKDDETLLKAEYLDEGIIDSLQIVELVSKLEALFNIRFTHTDLESEKFRTLSGVAGIIRERQGGKA